MKRKARRRTNWHRLFGIALTDYFSGSGYRVELEEQLAVKPQLLDVVIIEQEKRGKRREVCDGLENLAPYNLLSYKSMRESLTAWSLEELVSHYVGYRKKRGLRKVQAEEVKLFAVCTKRPRALFQQVAAKQLRAGVYDVPMGTRPVRVVVLREVEPASRNTLWELFSGEQQRVREGVEHHRWRDIDCRALLTELYFHYQAEGVEMPYTVKQFRKDVALDLLEELDPQERLQGLKPEQRLQGLRPEQRLRGLKPEERLQGLKPEERLQGLEPEQRLRGLSLAEIEAYLARRRKRKH